MRFWRRRGGRDEHPRDLGGEPVVRGPQGAYYQRLRGEFTKVASNGTLTLTQTQLVFQSRIGKGVTVPMADITDVRDQPIRRFHLMGHDTQLVIATQAGEIGFLLDDSAGWASTVRSQLEA